ncbi:hypothetical protein GWK73_03270 [Candidatus Saccharibacteria bacterium oral taxon 955]|jgi:hypothetical protein|nr:hypothetical protein GWK73_03270 [Candidatus Saccharibacteria bacterium oral taxon 955]
MNTSPTTAEYISQTAESVVSGTQEYLMTDLERAQFEASSIASDQHPVNPDTELYDQGRIESIGAKVLDVANDTVEPDPTDPRSLREIGACVVRYREAAILQVQ